MSVGLKKNSINNFCRICVKKSETLRCLSDLEISEKLQICSNISISKEEGFPEKICYSCELLLQATCRFQILCETASEKWKKYVKSFNIIQENYKKKKQKESTLKKDICYALPEYVEVKPDTEENFFNEQVPELKFEKKGITNVEGYVFCDSKTEQEQKNEFCSEPVEILLERFDREKINIETNNDDKKFNSEDDDDNALSYDHNKSDYSNYDSDKSYKPECMLKKKKKVKMKHDIRKSCYKTSNNHIEDYDGTNRKILRIERKSKTNPPKSKRKIFVAKIIPMRQERQESSQTTSSEEKVSKLNAKSLQCFLCGQILENTNKFRKHLLFHERNKNKSIYNSLDLDPNEKVLCEICGLALENTSALQAHSMLHAENFPYQCKLCPHRTRQAISLKIHMRKHTGEKPYACPHCKNVFSTSSNRLKHIRTKHTTGPDRPFQCEICKRHCSSKVTLENHLDSIHYKIKKHYCEHCNSGFYSRKRMLFHRRKVHNVSAEVKGRIPSYIQKEREKSKNKLMVFN